MTKSKKMSKTRQKFDFRMNPKITTFLPKCFWITALHLVCCCTLRPKKKMCVFTVPRPTLIFGLDPKLFCGLLVENYLNNKILFLLSNVVKGSLFDQKRNKCHSLSVEMHSRCHPISIQLYNIKLKKKNIISD